ncbi:MAG: polysaccharide deacetylase family protein [Oscillospiraceae bacterium]|nr:polysaccharide deacetylase family protein [Oscillospiraceae bacterium]
MPKKYFVWSFDDGVVQDRQIVRILRECGLGATFHLNSGLFGAKTFIGHPPTVPHVRLEAAEALELYDGFEIAAHTCTHRDLSKCTAEERRHEIVDDIAALSRLFGREITGFAYPYGRGAAECREALIASGVRYARTVETAPDFRLPKDPLRLPITCRQNDPAIFDRMEAFFRSEAEENQLFLAFAHGYEFDYDTEHSSWNRFCRICEAAANQPGLTFCSIQDVFTA